MRFILTKLACCFHRAHPQALVKIHAGRFLSQFIKGLYRYDPGSWQSSGHLEGQFTGRLLVGVINSLCQLKLRRSHASFAAHFAINVSLMDFTCLCSVKVPVVHLRLIYLLIRQGHEVGVQPVDLFRIPSLETI